MKAVDTNMEVATEPTEMRMPRFKKTRRGKKRRFHLDEDAYNPWLSPPCSESEIDSSLLLTPDKSENYFPNQSFAGHKPEGATTYSFSGKRRLILRPLEVPKAPNNSTTFIMDDHSGCDLYMSFESPRRRDDLCHSPQNGYRDINYEYESPDDMDTTAYMVKEFETIYRRAREDELWKIARKKLISQMLQIEETLIAYEKMLNIGDLPSIPQLQDELLEMQEENASLRRIEWDLLHGSDSGLEDSFDGNDISIDDNDTAVDDNDAVVDDNVQYVLD